jgi:plasmid maintenance system antidote protein VapI
MKMRIKDGFKLRSDFASVKDWWTIDAAAAGLGMSTRTVNKLFQGHTINHKTAKEVADALGVDVMSIAEFVKPNKRNPTN